MTASNPGGPPSVLKTKSAGDSIGVEEFAREK